MLSLQETGVDAFGLNLRRGAGKQCVGCMRLLLDFRDQFMCQHSLAPSRFRRILRCAKRDISAHRKCPGIDGLRGFRCPRVCMYSHLAKIRTKPLFEKSACGWWQGATPTLESTDIR